jgi:hypothetical protein
MERRSEALQEHGVLTMTFSRKDDPGENAGELQWICNSVLQSSFNQFRGTEIRASFYPYIGLTHTIRRNGDVWNVRVSDHCRHAPRAVLEAVVYILGCKIIRRKPPVEMIRLYERFRSEPLVEAAVDQRRLRRGRKIIGSPVGKHHSLEEIYCALNGKYFNDQIEIRKLGWGPRRGWSRLGHYDPVHHTITISPVLDSARVPRWAVAFVVYHELLHAVFDGGSGTGSRRHHPPAFRRAEQGYEDYSSAKRFLSEFCGSRGRRFRDGC